MVVNGLLYVILTFIISFIMVHLIKLAIVGFLSTKKKPKSEPAPQKSEPVYYIVEKKRARKSTYSAPKEIEFKK